MELLLLPLLLLLLSPAASSSSSSSSSSDEYYNKYHCDWCPRHSTASLFPPSNYKQEVSSSSSSSSSSDESSAAAAFGLGKDYDVSELVPDGFHLAAATTASGEEGGCYQLRCRDRRLCGDDGVNVAVVVTETKAKANGTAGFLLTRDAFTAMARNASVSHQLAALLEAHHLLQVDFRRIPCEYRKKNLAVRVEEEGSRRPSHLAVRFLYQGGLTDIAAVEVAHQQGGAWRSMARRRRKLQGVVWRTASAPPAGPLQLRLVVTAGSGGKWLRTTAALPADWRPGGVYDTGLRVTDVAVRACTRSCGRFFAGDDEDEDELR